MSIAFDGIKEDNYRIGDLQALRYDRNAAPFYDGYLAKIYTLCRESKRRSGDGILTATFGGNPASHFDAVVPFLAARPLIVLGEWKEDVFHEAGFAFPVVTCGSKDTELSQFAGYGFFSHVWGKPELPVLAMLGLTYMFNEWGLHAIHGTRFEENLLTARFMAQFGFKEDGRIPKYQLRDGKLVPAIVTTLMREDFEKYVENWLVEAFKENPIAMVGTAEHPAIEESTETIDAQVGRLASGSIPVVFFPRDSVYVPPIPQGMELRVAQSGPGAGIYFFNPQKISGEQIDQAAAEGTHGKLLGHVQNKTDLLPNSPVFIIQAIGPDGVVLQDSVVERTAAATSAQIDEFRRRFPDCEVKVSNPVDVLNERVAAKKEESPQLSLAWL